MGNQLSMQQLETENRYLSNQLEKLKQHLTIMQQTYEQEIANLGATIAKLKDALEHLSVIEATETHLLDYDQAQIFTDTISNQMGKKVEPLPTDNYCLVQWVACISKGGAWEVYKLQEPILSANSPESFVSQVLPRIAALSGGVPTQDDLPNRDLPGVTQSTLLNSVHKLAPFWHGSSSEDAADAYRLKRDEIFREDILPELDLTKVAHLSVREGEVISKMQERFNDCVDACFRNMIKKGRGQFYKKPDVKSGRLPKSR